MQRDLVEITNQFHESHLPTPSQQALGNLVTLKAIHQVWLSPKAGPSNFPLHKGGRRRRPSSRESQDEDNLNIPKDSELPIFGHRLKSRSGDPNCPSQEESRYTEFKSLTRTQYPIPRLLDLAEKYTNAFLNSEGGELYFGVEDDAVVHGLLLGPKDRDQVRVCLSAQFTYIPSNSFKLSS